MKTDVIAVSNRSDDIDAALLHAEKAAEYKNLPRKSALHLRLLTEEMLGMVRSITGEVDGQFWIETEGDVFQLHLDILTNMDYEQRKQLISASSSGKNEATRGLMGKIRSFFEPVEDIPPFLTIIPDGMYAETTWSMRAYEEQLLSYIEQKRIGAAEAWDELEKSVVSHIADDVRVSIRGREVEMVIYKKMA